MKTIDLLKKTIHELRDPVSFTITVGGKKLGARFVSSVQVCEREYRFRIKFSDGHTGEYELNHFTVYTSEGREDIYTKALSKEIYMPLCCWNPDSRVYVIRCLVNAAERNIWIVGHDDLETGEKTFSVYYSNGYRFSLRQNEGSWISKSQVGNKPPDQGLLQKVVAAINYFDA